MEQVDQKVLIVFNPKSGNAAQAETIRSMLAKYFTAPLWTFEIHEITGEEDVTAICKKACEQNIALVVAAGGDGTVLSVANGLIHTPVPLGILPLGTGNDLARVLSVPIKLEDALDLLVGEHDTIEIDALKVGERYFFSNVSVGISPVTMQETAPEQKKRFGRLAYLWTVFKRANIFHLHSYRITIDGQSRRIRASEVLISNPTMLEGPTRLFGQPETVQDGQLEAYLLTASTIGDYLRLLWDLLRHPGHSAAKLHHWAAKQRIRIDALGAPQLVQADGEVIGHTPVEVELIPKAIHVIMPKPKPAEASV
jgi:diacylglycerol kinase (ATP)